MKHMQRIGEYIQQLAKQQNVSDALLAALINCKESHIREFFRGSRVATYSQLLAMCDYLSVKISDVLSYASDS